MKIPKILCLFALPLAALATNVNVQQPSGLYTDNALVRRDGTGNLVQNGVVTEDDFNGTLNGPLNNTTTTAVGSAFTNQPANDSVTIVSSNAGDTTQSVTIIGTTNGTDTVVVETIALNGVTPVPSVKADWGIILAVKKSAVTLGTVTVSETSGGLTITAGLTAAVTSVGVNTVLTANQPAYNRTVSLVGSGTTTKQIGLQGTNTSGTVIYDSKALTNTTAVLSNSAFYTVTEIYTGDIEGTRTATERAQGILLLNVGSVAIGNYTSDDPVSANLKLGNSAASTNMVMMNYGNENFIRGYAAGGVFGAPTAIGITKALLSLNAGGYNGSAFSGTKASITFQTAEAWTLTANGTRMNFSTTMPGSTTLLDTVSITGGTLNVGRNNRTVPAWGTLGADFGSSASTITDSSSSGTVAIATANSFGIPTFAASSATLYTNADTVYIAGAPVAGTNVTIGTGNALRAATGNIDVTTGQYNSAGSRINYNLSAYGTGTVYTFTNTAAAVVLGTTSPTLTIDKAGTYLIFGQVQMAYAGATVVAETATVTLRRTNNTPADLTSGSTVIDLPVATTLTYTYGTVHLPQVIYTTTNTNDVVTLFANVSATLGVGTITAEPGGTFIQAIRLY